jgi:hypothetical protein
VKAIPIAKERAFAYEAFTGNGPLGAPHAWPRNKELPKQSSISNRDKGLQNGVRGLGPNVNHAHCVWHLGKNVQENHGNNAKKLFLKLVYAPNHEKFDAILAELQAKCGDVSNITIILKVMLANNILGSSQICPCNWARAVGNCILPRPSI